MEYTRPQASSEPLLDSNIINSLVSLADAVDDYDFLKEAFDAFLTHAPLRISSLRQQLIHNEERPLRDTAHSLKGSCANFGAKALADICARLEKLDFSADKARDEAFALIGDLDLLFPKTIAAIAKAAPQLADFIRSKMLEGDSDNPRKSFTSSDSNQIGL